MGDMIKRELAARADSGLTKSAHSDNFYYRWMCQEALANEFFSMRTEDEPRQGLTSVKAHMRLDAKWWKDCDYPEMENGRFKLGTYDGAGSVGDQFETAYGYLWIADQPRALAIWRCSPT